MIDISDPTTPSWRGSIDRWREFSFSIGWGVASVFVQGNYAYVAADADDGLQVIDISDPTNPRGVGQLTDDGEFSIGWGEVSVFVQGNYAYVASES